MTQNSILTGSLFSNLFKNNQFGNSVQGYSQNLDKQIQKEIDSPTVQQTKSTSGYNFFFDKAEVEKLLSKYSSSSRSAIQQNQSNLEERQELLSQIHQKREEELEKLRENVLRQRSASPINLNNDLNREHLAIIGDSNPKPKSSSASPGKVVKSMKALRCLSPSFVTLWRTKDNLRPWLPAGKSESSDPHHAPFLGSVNPVVWPSVKPRGQVMLNYTTEEEQQQSKQDKTLN
ncbi:MAG: hypothetical protein EZS28_005058 [Streblomastix strix]|uniref:Uncharacterized protein n=1 Tax=Streblomastix strix TaxID=222440 RepID=A0A5J4WWJ6_9EUKA|nr:MAG: hypothetical protein EZS28_005058 [Streblomastix strix]